MEKDKNKQISQTTESQEFPTTIPFTGKAISIAYIYLCIRLCFYCYSPTFFAPSLTEATARSYDANGKS